MTKNHFISLDAGFRNWMNEDSGDEVLPAMALNEPVMGLVLGEVIESKHSDYSPGTLMMARFAWQTHSFSDGTDFIARLPNTLEFTPSAYMGVLGDTGMSAYFGLTDIGKPTANDCVPNQWCWGGRRIHCWADRETLRVSSCGYRRFRRKSRMDLSGARLRRRA